MSKIVIVNGYAESGKSTFVDLCLEYIGKNKGTGISTVDVPKKIYTMMGGDGTKTLESRSGLSRCKDLLSENDMLGKYNVNCINEISQFTNIIFIFSREPYEIQKFVDYFDAITVFIKKDTKEKREFSNHADKEVENFNYECYIDNNGTIEDLLYQAIDFCDTFLGE